MTQFDKATYYLSRFIKKLRPSSLRDCKIDPTSAYEGGCQLVKTVMGRHSYCGYDCVFLNCEIGSFSSISDCVVIGGSQHPMHFVSTSPVFLRHRDSVKAKFSHHEFSDLPRTRVGNDVWIGHGARIKSGVTVGDGAVVGMGSVVTRDVAPYAIVGGNPATVIRMRFDDEIVDGLLKSQWWNYTDAQLRDAAVHFMNPKRFLSWAEKLR